VQAQVLVLMQVLLHPPRAHPPRARSRRLRLRQVRSDDDSRLFHTLSQNSLTNPLSPLTGAGAGASSSSATVTTITEYQIDCPSDIPPELLHPGVENDPDLSKWSELWQILERHGWTNTTGSTGNTVYLRPGFSSESGAIELKNKFSTQSAVVDYIKVHRINTEDPRMKSDRPEDMLKHIDLKDLKGKFSAGQHIDRVILKKGMFGVLSPPPAHL
jgi:hypothetical protein